MYETFVVNLDRDTEKWASIQSSATWPLTRFSAVDGEEEKDYPFYMNAFMIGCLRSHKRLWEMISARDAPCLVLEDDCVLPPDFESRVAEVMATIPDDWDIAVLGYSASDVSGDTLLAAACNPFMKRRTMYRVNNQWYVPGFFFGTHCYLLRPSGGKKLVRNTNTYHADAVLCRDTSLDMYCPARSIAQQAKLPGVYYNDHLTWKWLLAEPLCAVGGVTIKLSHGIVLYAGVLGAMLVSRKKAWRTAGIVAITIPLVHYAGTADTW